MPYPSLQNIAPHVWGPHGWKFMHAVALAYPENPSAEEKKAAFQFFSSLEYMLPCESCKQNFRGNEIPGCFQHKANQQQEFPQRRQ